MKTIIAISVALLLVGCDACDEAMQPPKLRQPRQQEQEVSKTIIAKEAPVEQRMGLDVFAKDPFQTKSATIYYLIAEDGTVVEVGLSDYATAHVGQPYSALESKWRRK
jgi:hypothetical protein